MIASITLQANVIRKRVCISIDIVALLDVIILGIYKIGLHVARVYADHRARLTAQLAEPFDGRTIVVRHHAALKACLQDDPEAYSLICRI